MKSFEAQITGDAKLCDTFPPILFFLMEGCYFEWSITGGSLSLPAFGYSKSPTTYERKDTHLLQNNS